MIFGLSEPIFLMIVIAAIVVLIKLLPFLAKRGNNLDYSNWNVKNSVAYFHYLGRGGSGFSGKKQSKPMIDHGNHRVTLFLEGLPMPITDVNLNPDDPEKDYKIIEDHNLISGTRIDVYLRKDANSIRYDWSNIAVTDMVSYQDRMREVFENKILSDNMKQKEIQETMKGERSSIDSLLGNER